VGEKKMFKGGEDWKKATMEGGTRANVRGGRNGHLGQLPPQTHHQKRNKQKEQTHKKKKKKNTLGAPKKTKKKKRI